MQRTSIFLALFLTLNLTAPAATKVVPTTTTTTGISIALAGLSLAPEHEPLHIKLSPENPDVYMELYPCVAPGSRVAICSKEAVALLNSLVNTFADKVKAGKYRSFDHTIDDKSPDEYCRTGVIGLTGKPGGLWVAPRIVACMAESMVNYMLKAKTSFDWTQNRKANGALRTTPFSYLDHALSIEAIIYGIMYGQPYKRWNERTETNDLCFIMPCIVEYHSIKAGTPTYTEDRWLKLAFDYQPKQKHVMRLYHACLHKKGPDLFDIPCKAHIMTNNDDDIIFKFGH